MLINGGYVRTLDPDLGDPLTDVLIDGDKIGAIGRNLTASIHCTDSDDEELDLIAKTGGTTSVAPYVEMLTGHGVPPTGRLVARGVSLSIDVVSSVPGDMFTQSSFARIPRMSTRYSSAAAS